MKLKTFFIVFEGLKEQKFDKKYRKQALIMVYW